MPRARARAHADRRRAPRARERGRAAGGDGVQPRAPPSARLARVAVAMGEPSRRGDDGARRARRRAGARARAPSSASRRGCATRACRRRTCRASPTKAFEDASHRTEPAPVHGGGPARARARGVLSWRRSVRSVQRAPPVAPRRRARAARGACAPGRGGARPGRRPSRCGAGARGLARLLRLPELLVSDRLVVEAPRIGPGRKTPLPIAWSSRRASSASAVRPASSASASATRGLGARVPAPPARPRPRRRRYARSASPRATPRPPRRACGPAPARASPRRGRPPRRRRRGPGSRAGSFVRALSASQRAAGSAFSGAYSPTRWAMSFAGATTCGLVHLGRKPIHDRERLAALPLVGERGEQDGHAARPLRPPRERVGRRTEERLRLGVALHEHEGLREDVARVDAPVELEGAPSGLDRVVPAAGEDVRLGEGAVRVAARRVLHPRAARSESSSTRPSTARLSVRCMSTGSQVGSSASDFSKSGRASPARSSWKNRSPAMYEDVLVLRVVRDGPGVERGASSSPSMCAFQARMMSRSFAGTRPGGAGGVDGLGPRGGSSP